MSKTKKSEFIGERYVYLDGEFLDRVSNTAQEMAQSVTAEIVSVERFEHNITGMSEKVMLRTKKTQHTPGPWIIDFDQDWDIHKCGTVVAKVPDDNGLKTEINQANAALIAAAPSMLADLERALSVLDSIKNGERWDSECDFHTDCVRETIAKAKGEVK